jgi:predicted transcriptional regulator
LAEEMMTSQTTVLNPEDSVNYTAEIFMRNEFHAIPIVAGEKLMGIITTYDLLKYAYPMKF